MFLMVLVFGVVLVLTFGVVLLMTRPTSAERTIEGRIAKLQAAGIPMETSLLNFSEEV